MLHGPLRRALLKAQLAVREVSALSPRTMGAIVANTFRMARTDAAWRASRRTSSVPCDAGRYTGADVLDGGTRLAVTFERATLHVRALEDALIRLAWGPGPEPYDVATRDATLVAPSGVGAATDTTGAWLATAALRVEVGDFGVRVHDTAGVVRYEERSPLFDGIRRTMRRVLRDGEVLRGLGEQARSLDLAGGSYRMWNRDPGGSWGTGQNPLYCSIPITVGVHPSGAVWSLLENTHEASVTVGPVDHAAHGVQTVVEGGSLVSYVALGELDEVLTTATRLLGAPAMPPRWALGYHHCRWGWRTDRAVGEVLDGFASRGLPVSAIHLDIDHMDGYRVFTFDEERFGGVTELARSARERGTRMVVIVDPAVRRDDAYELYREGTRDGHLVTDPSGEVQHGTVWPGWAAFPDFTRADTRAWWGSKYAALTSRGVAGVWHDMNEPTSITLWGDRTLPRSSRFDLDGRGGDHAEAHQVYGLSMDRAGHEALAGGGDRPFVLSRAGWAGLARWSWHWTADVESSPEGLAQQVPTFVGLGLSSVPFTGSDVGGFSGIPTPELYVRWLELGVVSPFFRTHCVLGAPDREPWRFEPPVEAAASRLLRLRYRLLPYLYRLAEEAHRLGHPLWRPLDWPVEGAQPGDAASSEAFLLGDELACVPVARPASGPVTFTLPGGRWRRLRPCAALDGELGTEHEVPGGSPTTLDAPLGQPVILQRAGTVVVLDDGWQHEDARLDADHAARRWSLHVVLDDHGTARGTGYDDAGDGVGVSRHDTYSVVRANDELVVHWHGEGDYERVGAVDVVIHGLAATGATADGVPAVVQADASGAIVALTGPFAELVLRGVTASTPGGPRA